MNSIAHGELRDDDATCFGFSSASLVEWNHKSWGNTISGICNDRDAQLKLPQLSKPPSLWSPMCSQHLFCQLSGFENSEIWNGYPNFRLIPQVFSFDPVADGTGPRVSIAVALLSLGEGWHDYHHLFPWDYAAAAPERLNWQFWNQLVFYFPQ